MPSDLNQSLSTFVRWSEENITGDEKGEAQIFLDRFFQALGHDLIDAENKLLNYYWEVHNNAAFLQEFGVTHPSHVCLGGIIIGSNKCLVSGALEQEEALHRYQTAHHLRTYYMYGAQMRLFTWSYVLEYLRRREAVEVGREAPATASAEIFDASEIRTISTSDEAEP